jgi:chemotaxis protein methyltransferase CheR
MMVAELSPDMDRLADLACFKDLLLHACGHNFENEREHALATALGRRMGALAIRRHDVYHARLLRDQDELRRLTELLTVNETYFFREPEHLRLIIDMLPEFMAARSNRPIRILSAGCSTGEEPYSIAMLLRERFGIDSERLFAITGVDIDSNVIASAREGVYRESSFRGINDALLGRYFKPFGSGQFRIDETIGKQVEFEVVNLLGTAYPKAMQAPDIILYRNVSIYFPSQVQRQIFHRLADLLVEGGCLLVGATETMHHDLGILSLVKQDSLFYYRKTARAAFQERRTQGGLMQHPGRERRTVQPPPAAHAPNSTASHWPAGQSPKIGECYVAALDLARKHRADESIALLDAILSRDAFFSKAYVLKANLLLSESRFDEGAGVCEQSLEHDPLCPETYLMLGMCARHHGDDEGALKRFREAAYLDPACWLAHFFSAEIHYGHGEEKRARSCYEAASRILEKSGSQDGHQEYFTLAVNVDQFAVVCRHKLSLLTRKKLQKDGL